MNIVNAGIAYRIVGIVGWALSVEYWQIGSIQQ